MKQKTLSNKLKEIRISGGFLDGLIFKPSEHLNCVIGARGTGKTSLVEFIRYALDIMPSDLAARKRIETLVESNLAGGRIDIAVDTKDGLSYVISRTVGEAPMVLDVNGRPSGINFSRAIFSVDVFSQNDVESIAGNAASQLALIESFSQEELLALNQDIDKLRRHLEENTKSAVPLQTKIKELRDQTSILPNLTERLAGYSQVLDEDSASISKANTMKSQRDREQSFADALAGIYKTSGERFKAMQDFVAQQLAWHGTENVSEGENFDLLTDMLEELSLRNNTINQLLAAILDEIAQGQLSYQEARKKLLVSHQSADVEYNRLVEKSNADRTLIAERMKLERERNRLLEMQRQMGETIREYNQLKAERQTLLNAYTELIDRRFILRKSIVDCINDNLMPNIRVSLKQLGNSEIYQNLLAEGLKRCQIQHRQVAARIAAQLSPTALIELIGNEDESSLMSIVGMNKNQARAVISSFSGEEAIEALEIVDMPDLPCIELLDTDVYKPTETLSTGQKCNAILPIVLLDSNRPLIVDQPEDNLDNGFIHRIIVRSVSDVKQHRQLMFVTHNPNIPVLGDAERILVLDSNGVCGHIKNCGSVDDCKEEILSLLEGGRDAFRKRQARYAN